MIAPPRIPLRHSTNIVADNIAANVVILRWTLKIKRRTKANETRKKNELNQKLYGHCDELWTCTNNKITTLFISLFFFRFVLLSSIWFAHLRFDSNALLFLFSHNRHPQTFISHFILCASDIYGDFSSPSNRDRQKSRVEKKYI